MELALVQPMANLLALDQASHITGWSIFQEDKLIEYGKIVANQGDLGERLYYIKQEVLKLIDKYNIDEIVMEDIQMQNNIINNVQTFKTLAELFGVLYETFTELKIPNSAILASSWKSVLGVKGKDRAVQKKNAQQWVIDNYNIKVIQDIADSICIGAAYLKQQKSEYDWS